MTNFKNTVNIIDSVFGIKRFVNAKNKTIININSNEANEHCCFDFWERDKACTNCISMRAINDNKSYSKFETVDDKLYMIIASPIKINENMYVVELVKDVSEDTIASQFNYRTYKELESEILRLNKLVVTDELTSIYNRRYINENLPSSINRLSSSLKSLAIVIVDVDKFKSINDKYGHVYGDYVLRDVSHKLNDFINDYDGWVARYGGDEFIMLFEDLDEYDTERMLKKLKKLISHNKFVYEDVTIDVSCSLGHTIVKESNVSFEQLMKDIDKKLYINKKQK